MSALPVLCLQCVHVAIICTSSSLVVHNSSLCFYGSWENKLIERVHNVAKSSKKRSCESTSTPPAKRGRPPKFEDPMLQRYPPVQLSDTCTDDGNATEALSRELEKDKPRKDVVLPLLKETFAQRRHYILSTQTSVADITAQYKALLLPYAVSLYSTLYAHKIVNCHVLS